MRGVPGSLPPHGNYGRYTNHGCRCKPCTKAWSEYHKKSGHRSGRHLPWNEAVALRNAFLPPHGTVTRYKHGCRCSACREASAAQRRAYREAHPESTVRENEARRERYRLSRAS